MKILLLISPVKEVSMKDEMVTRFPLSYRGKHYWVSVNSINYADAVVINKLKIGYISVWLILEKDVWRFISNMPVCCQLRSLLVRMVTKSLDLTSFKAKPKIEAQMQVKAAMLLHAVLSTVSPKKELSS